MAAARSLHLCSPGTLFAAICPAKWPVGDHPPESGSHVSSGPEALVTNGSEGRFTSCAAAPLQRRTGRSSEGERRIGRRNCNTADSGLGGNEFT